MPSIGQTWVLASIGAVVEMGVLTRTLKRLLMESTATPAWSMNLFLKCQIYKKADMPQIFQWGTQLAPIEANICQTCF
jgi:hypothetical protein